MLNDMGLCQQQVQHTSKLHFQKKKSKILSLSCVFCKNVLSLIEVRMIDLDAIVSLSKD